MEIKSALEIAGPASGNELYVKVEKKSGKRIGGYYIILKSFKKSKKNDVFKCIYIKSLFNFGTCVIKEGSYGDTKDIHGRDIRDRLIWQKQLHLALQDKIKTPRFLGSFEESGNFYLVLEFIRGVPFYKKLKKYNKEIRTLAQQENNQFISLLDNLLEISIILQTLHANKYVHRDITPSNFLITNNGHVYIIDLELAYSLANDLAAPFQLGTYGYMSPQQVATKLPTVQDDIFSFGAVIFEVITGIHPIKLSNEQKELPSKIYALIQDEVMANLVLSCLDADPLKRPAIESIRKSLHVFITDLKNGNIRTQTQKKIKFSPAQILETVQSSISTLSSPLLADPEHGWFSENVSVEKHQDKHKINKAWYASFYSGASGIIYLLSKAKQSSLCIGASPSYISAGLKTIELRYITTTENTNTGLLFGGAGIAVAIASAISSGLLNSTTEYIKWMCTLLTRKSNGIDYMHGAAGKGIALMRCNHLLPSDFIERYLTAISDSFIAKQLPDGSWHTAIKEKGGKKILGFANGLSGIIWFLYEFGYTYHSSAALSAAEKGLNWLIKEAALHKGEAGRKSTLGRHHLHNWSEGAAGIALTMLKASYITQNNLYKKIAKSLLRSINGKIIDNNLSHGYGLSGLGEVYLEAFNILKDEEWLERADWIAYIIMHLQKTNSAHGPYWLVQNERVPTADFFEGNSGVIHFLLRYCSRGNGFPLLK